MDNFFFTIFAFIIAISILVSFHEYGHFLIARLFKVKVLNFSIGFGPKLIKKTTKQGTEFSVSLIPLGGYVKMLDEREAPVPNDQLSYAFNRKAPWKKILIVSAGPVFNFILAFIVFYFMYVIGIEVERPVIQYIVPNSLAEQAGMKPMQEVIKVDNVKVNSIEDLQIALAAYIGTSHKITVITKDFEALDQINSKNNLNTHAYQLSVQNWQVDLNKEPVSTGLGLGLLPKEKNQLAIESLQPPVDANLVGLQPGDLVIGYNNKIITDWSGFINFIKNNPKTQMTIDVLRKDVKKSYDITIGTNPKTKLGFLGVAFKYPFYLKKQTYGFLESFKKSLERTVYYIQQTFYMIYKLFVGHLGLETVRGPVMVAKAAAIEIQLGIADFLSFLGIISIGLGVINILPIPVLDGGHVVYHSYEWITGKTPSLMAEKIAVVIGVLCLTFIMGIAFYNDIMYW
ncbi:MAG: RIP metalloprotease RseP [Gammaproteobacteria bacterium]|nr:RIP metalloprotease RseP [Gammaproteobacteria bacterium]